MWYGSCEGGTRPVPAGGTTQETPVTTPPLASARAAIRPGVSPWRWVVAGVLLLTIVTGFFDRISVAVLFTNPGFNAALGTGLHPAALGLLMTGFLLAYAVSALLLSVVGDLFGPRRALGTAALLWGGAMMVMGSCHSYAVMLLSRVALGVTEGPQFSFVAKAVQQWFPAGERSRATAIWMVGSPLGSAIGFPLTISLVAHYGWRASFFVFGAVNILLVAPLVFAVLRGAPATPAEAAPAARVRAADIRALLGDRHVWMLSVYCMGLMTYIWGLNSWLPTYLARARHFNLREMGFYSSLPFVLMFAGEIASGVLADRTGRRALISTAGLFLAGALLFVGTQMGSPAAAAVVIALSAACWGLATPSELSLAMRVLPPGATSAGIGLINGIGNLVGAAAPAAIGVVVAATGSFGSGLLVVVGMSMVCSLALLPMIRSH
jgi:sugar phosphate permease